MGFILQVLTQGNDNVTVLIREKRRKVTTPTNLCGGGGKFVAHTAPRIRRFVKTHHLNTEMISVFLLQVYEFTACCSILLLFPVSYFLFPARQLWQ